ncbi:hypothetical protein BJS_06694 [Bradyrhizobium japonicum SEMIA 5079]|nr:hypothetical protein BJS_06694 [Bradyrhizobium japonicum SEMIA 5079]
MRGLQVPSAMVDEGRAPLLHRGTAASVMCQIERAPARSKSGAMSCRCKMRGEAGRPAAVRALEWPLWNEFGTLV